MSIPAPVSTSFVKDTEAHFLIRKKGFTNSSGKFKIEDGLGNLLFSLSLERKIFSIHVKRILRDAAGRGLVLITRKKFSVRGKWEVYRYDSEQKEDGQLLFTMKKSHIFSLKSSFDVFLASNMEKSKPDFILKGDFFAFNYSVYYGNQETPIANASRKINASAILLGRNQYLVTTSPGVDQVFIATLVISMDQDKQYTRNHNRGAMTTPSGFS